MLSALSAPDPVGATTGPARLCAPAFEQGSSGAERAEFSAPVGAAHAALTGG